MLTYQLLLIFHLAGAVVILLFIIETLFAVKSNRSPQYASLAAKIGLGSGLQLITGSFLTVFSPEKTTRWQFCSRIGIYLSIVVAIELFLFYKIRQKDLVYPAKLVIPSIVSGMIFVLLVIKTFY